MDSKISKATPMDADIVALRREFLANMWRGLLWIAVLSLPLTAVRVQIHGLLPLYSFHLVIAVIVAAIALVQERFSLSWRAGLLIGLLWLVGLPGVLTFGLAASGVWWLVLSCLVATTLYSPRFGIAVSLATGLALSVAGAGFVSGVLHPAIPAARYLVLPSSWLAVILVAGIFSVLVLQSFGGYARAIERLLLRIKEQRDEIERLSLHDPLTGLPLASLATDRIQMALHAARRSGKRVALLYIDLDGFKRVNDDYGHDAGDAVLQACARRMHASLRQEDTIARVGGDEFIAVVGGLADPLQAECVARKLVHAAAQTIQFEGKSVTIGASVGIAVFPDDGSDATMLRRSADQAMYEAKRRGRNGFAWATPPRARPRTESVSG
jgi:diguanylate cyclase (GGDEF)-like protein